MDLVNHLEDRLLFAVPKKGRLQEPVLDLLLGSDIRFRREPRLDIALVKNLPLALVFLPAQDIPTFVGGGRVDLGITGRDQIAEHNASLPAGESPSVAEVMDLGFGECKLQVQVPESGDIVESAQLIGKNVVTSFTGLTQAYFSRLENAKGIGQEGGPGHRPSKTNIRLVNGSVETACALGVADGVVDLVESGETMRAAGLQAIDTVMESTAVLIKSKNPTNAGLVELIATRIKGVITAQKYVLCQYNIPRLRVHEGTALTPGKQGPTITALDGSDWVAVSAMVEKREVATVMDSLTAVGATDVLILDIVNSRTG